MSQEVNRALARRYFEGNRCVADEIFDANVSCRDPVVAIDGADRLKRFFLMLQNAFAYSHYVLEKGIAEGDKVVNCFSSRGTCLGGFEGTQFSGRQFSVMGVLVSSVSATGRLRKYAPSGIPMARCSRSAGFLSLP